MKYRKRSDTHRLRKVCQILGWSSRTAVMHHLHQGLTFSPFAVVALTRWIQDESGIHLRSRHEIFDFAKYTQILIERQFTLCCLFLVTWPSLTLLQVFNDQLDLWWITVTVKLFSFLHRYGHELALNSHDSNPNCSFCLSFISLVSLWLSLWLTTLIMKLKDKILPCSPVFFPVFFPITSFWESECLGFVWDSVCSLTLAMAARC